MAITFFGVATVPADNSAQAGPTVALTPPASMADGDLVLVSVRYRASASTITVGTTGGQTWTQVGAQYNTTNIRAAMFWCRFNGTWGANPDFTVTSGTNNMDAQMLVFRPTSAAYTWTMESGPNSATFAAPGAAPFNVTVTGRTTTAASTVTIAAWHSIDDNSWGTLSGTGWSKTSLAAQYRNNSTNDNSSTLAYNIRTTAGAVANVMQEQTALGADAGSTGLVTFAETQVSSALTGLAGTAAAGMLALSVALLGLAGLSVAANAGTIAVAAGGMSNATASPIGVAAPATAGAPDAVAKAIVGSTGVAGTVSVGALTILVPQSGSITGVSSTATAGSLGASITLAAIAGVSASPLSGTTIALTGSAAAGTGSPSGVAATPRAGILTGAVTTGGVAGVEGTATAGVAAISTSGTIHAAGQPSPVFATAQAGTALASGGIFAIQGVSATAIAEDLSLSQVTPEIDGTMGAGTAGNTVQSPGAIVTGVSATATAGTLATVSTSIVAPTGVAASAGAGTLAGFSSGFGVGIAAGVAATGAAGTIAPAWTGATNATGVASSGQVGTLTIDASTAISASPTALGVGGTGVVGDIQISGALAVAHQVVAAAIAGVAHGLGQSPADCRGIVSTGVARMTLASGVARLILSTGSARYDT